MMKKLVLALSLVLVLGSVNQARAVSGRVVYGAVGLAAVCIAGYIVYKYCVQEKDTAKDQTPASVEEEAILKRS